MSTPRLDTPSSLSAPPRRVVALVGNPNTGKTTLFNALSGLRQRVGNYPGVTVETKKGTITCAGQPFDIIDLPGTYSLAPRSPDEMVAVDVILGHQKEEPRPDVVVSIVDASNLERNLYLTTQAMELGVPVVIALNMIDVAEGQGIEIQVEELSQQFGVPVVPIQANKHKNLDQLREAIAAAASDEAPVKGVEFPDAFTKEVDELHRHLGEDSIYLTRRLVLDVGGFTEQRIVEERGAEFSDHLREVRQRLNEAGCPIPAIEAKSRYTWIRQATGKCVQRPTERVITWTDRIDKVLTHRLWGTLIFLGVMFLVFQAIFPWAVPLMDLIDGTKEAVADWLRPPGGVLPPGPLTDLLIDGVIEGVGSVIIFLPQILILFALIAILEDCGYMARAAFLMDKLMARCGLSGKSFIPLLSSVACAVPGIMATRVIENRHDRLATILVAPLMSCSARLPVYVLLIGAFLPVATASNPNGFAWYVPGLTMFAMYALGLIVAPLVALLLKRTLLRGDTPLFIMEMPLYKWPSLRTILGRMFDSGWAFMRRAGTIIFASMIVIWALLYFPRGIDGAYDTNEPTFDRYLLALDRELAELEEREADEDTIEAKQQQIRDVKGTWVRQTYLGRLGHAMAPVFRPLGWDWKLGTAALASFPAREVVVGTLAILYSVEEEDMEDSEQAGQSTLASALRGAKWDHDPSLPVFTVPVALSLMVFFALCCQCVSTLAVIRRETLTWRWPIFTFVYMTLLAYIGAFAVFQIGSLLL